MWLSEINRKNEFVNSFDGAVYLDDDGSVIIETSGASIAINGSGEIQINGAVTVTGNLTVNGKKL